MRVLTDIRLQTWGLDLLNSDGTLTGSSPAANTATWPAAASGTAGSGNSLLTGAGFIDFNPDDGFAPAGDHLLLTFTLSGGNALSAVTGRVNVNEFSDADAGDYDYDTRFADGAGAAADQGRTTGNLIVLVPEPATLGLLSLGVLAFARRRRTC
jgi:hypothetical protein